MKFVWGNMPEENLITPDPLSAKLTEKVEGRDQDGATVATSVTVERPLTLYLNSQEIVTMMTICDFPEYLALGYLFNQNMLSKTDVVTGVEYDEDLKVVVVRTQEETNFEDKLQKKTLTSGCAQGTAFGDVMEKFDDIILSTDTTIRRTELASLLKKINTTPSLYLEAGAIHGCVLCQGNSPLFTWRMLDVTTRSIKLRDTFLRMS